MKRPWKTKSARNSTLGLPQPKPRITDVHAPITAFFVCSIDRGVQRAGPATRHGVPRRAELERIARPGPFRQNDDHRPDRRDRAERSAYGARQAQFAGALSVRKDRPDSR